VQRGNNRQAIFLDDNDYQIYLDWLADAAGNYGCLVHAYVLMTNHVHLLLTPNGDESISTTLQALGRRFVPYVNRSHGRTGTLWEGRFKASLIQEERYLLACYRYIEMNPIRARMVKKPEDYRWSSYRANAFGEHDSLVTPHELYLALGATVEKRQTAYRDLFTTRLDPEIIRDVRACLQTGTPLGNDRFRAQIEQSLGVKLGHSNRGRPKKLTPE
jgi:putative transposase